MYLNNQAGSVCTASIVPAHFVSLYIRYAHELGSSPSRDLPEIRRCASDILKSSLGLSKLSLLEGGQQLERIIKEFKWNKPDTDSFDFFTDFLSKDIDLNTIVNQKYQYFEKLSQSANEMFKDKKYIVAIKLIEQALALFSPETPQVVSCRDLLVSCYLQTEDYETAKNIASENLRYTRALFNASLVSEDKLKKSEQKLHQATILYEARLKANDAKAKFLEGNYDAASNLFNTVIQQATEVQQESAELATYHYNLASCLFHKGDFAGAVAQQKICVAMREKVLGKNDKATKKATIKLLELDEKLHKMDLPKQQMSRPYKI
jgi:hypothetical protein